MSDLSSRDVDVNMFELPSGHISPYRLLDYLLNERRGGRVSMESAVERVTDLAAEHGEKALAVIRWAPSQIYAYDTLERFKFIAEEFRLWQIRGWWRPSDHLSEAENLGILSLLWARPEEQPHVDDLAALSAWGTFWALRAAEPAIDHIRSGIHFSGRMVLIRFAEVARSIRTGTPDPLLDRLRHRSIAHLFPEAPALRGMRMPDSPRRHVRVKRGKRR